MTKLCVSLNEKNTDSLLDAMHALPARVDVAEVRLDLMDRFDLGRICGRKDRPIIVTNRPAREGGQCRLTENQRLGALREAAEHGADYVDVELDAAAQLGDLAGGCAKILSHHNFQQTPDDLEGIFERMRSAGPDVIKIVTMARDIADVPRMFELLRRHAGRTPLIAFCMGEEGVASRVLAGKFGAFLTYASAAVGREAAQGQVPCDQMLQMYRFPSIGPETAVYGVIADPVAHSMSPAIHNAAFAQLGMDAVYLPFKVNDPKTFLEGFEPYALKGLSVTIPHKSAMLALLDEVAPLAAAIGAVNTVVIRGGKRNGYNTDVAAAVGALENAARKAGLYPLRGRNVLLVGAGGAARAIAYGLQEKGVQLTIANRTVKRAEALAADLGADHCGLEEMTAQRPDILVNSTAVGMWPHVDRSPVPRSMLRRGMVVFDSVYNPVRTKLLAEAEQAGCATATGLEWFVSQAVAQFGLWTGRSAPAECMERVVRARLGGHEI